MDKENVNPFDAQKKPVYAENIIAVASGKGGVGKSTVAANLALAIKQRGCSVGLLDLDLYGPSVPMMFGHHKPTESVSQEGILPAQKFGIQLMSLGFFLDSNSAVIWRGPLVMRAVEQLLSQVIWKKMDYLIIDLPPGTGDIQLSLVQKIALTAAIIVTTPQDLALADVKRGINMFKKVNVPILGIVENMSYFLCPECGHKSFIFGQNGGSRESERSGVPFLGEIALNENIMSAADTGCPIVESKPGGDESAAYFAIADKVIEYCKKA
ncbi:MAG: Mrp/NBP35 family ATP-binding protein [Candidatus Neomarinimicrobiota bacterium]|jgi:ATP-binding protein involved in chromosome partitioning|nr:Mrp/NBP35 family ATP-binding protein [Candidatus Neomarinimicrobiota bacterium]MDX9780012.1 Mrp/NBP35 family ATP-binding protein [bacterium]